MATTTQTKGPILITGAHRSGTTWVGRVLSEANDVFYVGEPFNPNHGWSPRTLLKKPFTDWFTYITERNAARYHPYLDATLGLNTSLLEELRSARGLRNAARVARRRVSAARDRWARRRPLMKDPIALYSAEWLADTYNMAVVVMIRHPAAFVASVKRLDWRFDFNNMLRQPELVRDLLPEFRDVIETYSSAPPSLVEMGITQWMMAYTVAERYRERRPEWHFVRHEDLALSPVEGFRDLCGRLGISWSTAMEAYIEESSAASNPVVTTEANDTRRDSRNVVRAWASVLTDDEIGLIRDRTEPLASRYYQDADW